ncbi:MAG: protease complex subunit PrcB family protein [Candidatus Contendobacter sp.]|nr:protease complex subunit PrcB family protein [Candidatus Contendobacter sp.]MDG4556191.1 protease complex subunit PrcB family protein [Candidatus Contendobacter sp.]
MALTMVTGCAQPVGNAAGDATLSIAALASQGQCGALDRPAVRWIARSQEWRELYARINSHWMDPPPPPAVDFLRAGVLLIAMGQRSTAGYGLALADDVATLRDGVVTVRVDWREPPPGRRQAQVMTSPCLLATMPAADFTRIRVVDREGRTRLEGNR